jgi:hypothetical protein
MPAQTASAAKPINAYGTNITPPAPIQFSLGGNLGNISNIIGQLNNAQNQANAANNQRYGQMLNVLNNAVSGQIGDLGNALGSVQQGYGNAAAALSGSLANNATVFNNEQERLNEQTQQAAGAANQSAVNRGLTNTSILNSMQDQVTRAANDAQTNIAAAKAQADNGVYQNLANIYANGGNAAANIQAQTGNAYMAGGDAIANAIQGVTQQAPSLSEYAPLIQAAQAGNNSQGKGVINTVNPVPINQGAPGTFSNGFGGGGGISGGIAASTGQGGFNSGKNGGGGNTTPSTPSAPQTNFPASGPSDPSSSPSDTFPNGVPDPDSFPGGGGDNSSPQNTPAAPTDQPTDGMGQGGVGIQPGGQYVYGDNGWIGYKNPDGSWVVINPGNGPGAV